MRDIVSALVGATLVGVALLVYVTGQTAKRHVVNTVPIEQCVAALLSQYVK